MSVVEVAGEASLDEEASASPDLSWRRRLFAGLVIATAAGLLAAMATLLGSDGLTWAEAGMLAGFSLTVPWNVLNLWSAVIGFILLHGARDPVGLVNPALQRVRGAEPVNGRVAIAMAVKDEGTERVFRHLALIEAELKRTGCAKAFDIFVLSDTTVPEVAAAEEAAFARWKAASAAPHRLHYRRRRGNAGYKAGNLREFCERWAGEFDLMVVLDADSLMSGEAILRLVRTMEANPALGILQTLPVGLPTRSLFARLFQFGMRQGMRPYAMGSAWWQGDCGPYWGHNAAIRMKPFLDHCRLPRLPGAPPLGGDILSHDQVEAALMRRAGYEVRVIPEEAGSFEENPPSLPEFIKRDLRWCQGNLQYWRLVGLPGLKPVSRVQIWLALLMYFGAPGWMAFMAFGLAQAFLPPSGEPFPVLLGQTLFWLMMAIVFAPVVLGLLDILIRPAERRRYGGATRAAVSSASALLFSFLIAPVMAVAQTVLMVGFLFGRTIRWEPQNRDTHYVPPGEALRGLWPQLALGLVYGALLLWAAPGALPWALPVLTGLILAVPLASLTSSVEAGRVARALGLCATPEEIERVPLVQAALAGPRPAERERRLVS